MPSFELLLIFREAPLTTPRLRGIFRAIKKQMNLLFFNKFIYVFICFGLRWAFVAARGLSLDAASGGYSSLWCAGFPLKWLLLLQSTGSRCAGLSSCGTQAQ